MKSKPRIKGSSECVVSSAMLALNAPKKELVLNLLKAGDSPGSIARSCEMSERVILHWRNEAGIKPIQMKGRKFRPTPELGAKLK